MVAYQSGKFGMLEPETGSDNLSYWKQGVTRKKVLLVSSW